MRLINVFPILILFGCSENQVKKMIIEPNPPAPIQASPSCLLQFKKEDNLKQTANQAALMTEFCGYSADQVKALVESTNL